MMIPAIDLIDGQVVRLFQGDYNQKTGYDYSPLERQRTYSDAGATTMHFVDLDGAKDSAKRQLSLIADLVKCDTMTIQVGGGIRSEQDLIDLFNAGADRAVIGSLAIKSPDLVVGWIKKYSAEKIVLALDIKIDEQGNKTLPTHGWIKDSGVNLEDIMQQYIDAGIKHILCTDISKDGTLGGSNVCLYQQLTSQYPNVLWQASGGIGSLEDIIALKPTGVAGVILGKSLLEGKFKLEEAMACWQDA